MLPCAACAAFHVTLAVSRHVPIGFCVVSRQVPLGFVKKKRSRCKCHSCKWCRAVSVAQGAVDGVAVRAVDAVAVCAVIMGPSVFCNCIVEGLRTRAGKRQGPLH